MPEMEAPEIVEISQQDLAKLKASSIPLKRNIFVGRLFGINKKSYPPGSEEKIRMLEKTIIEFGGTVFDSDEKNIHYIIQEDGFGAVNGKYDIVD